MPLTSSRYLEESECLIREGFYYASILFSLSTSALVADKVYYQLYKLSVSVNQLVKENVPGFSFH